MHRRGQRGKNSERGISLLESLFATMIMTVGVIGLAQGLGVAILIDSDSRTATSVLNLAQSRLEQLKDRSATQAQYDALADGVEYLASDGSPVIEPEQGDGGKQGTKKQNNANWPEFAEYEVVWEVTDGTLIDSSGQPASRTIQVTVTPAQNAYGGNDTVTLTTQVARPIS